AAGHHHAGFDIDKGDHLRRGFKGSGCSSQFSSNHVNNRMQLSDSEQITISDEECEHHASDEGRRRERLPASGQSAVREEVVQTVAGSSGDDGGQEELQVRGEDLPEIDIDAALLE